MVEDKDYIDWVREQLSERAKIDSLSIEVVSVNKRTVAFVVKGRNKHNEVVWEKDASSFRLRKNDRLVLTGISNPPTLTRTSATCVQASKHIP